MPRWYVTQQELDAVSSYMKGRLSVEKVRMITAHATVTSSLVKDEVNSRRCSGMLWKGCLTNCVCCDVQVNAAVDEMAGHAEATGRLLLAAQNSGQKLTTSERKKATELLHSVAVRFARYHSWSHSCADAACPNVHP